jgi:hypothetical protein
MIAPPYFTRIIIIILLLTITGNAMATQGKINWKSIMTSDEAYTYKPKVKPVVIPAVKNKNVWDKIFDNPLSKSRYKKINIKLF